MFDKITEQFENSLKPYSELVNINAKALEKLAQQNADLFTSNLKEGVAYAQELSAKKDMASVIETQKAFAENMQEKLTNAAKEAYSVLTAAQEQTGEVLKGAFAQAQETAKAVAPKAVKAAAK
jgi:phasin family protein